MMKNQTNFAIWVLVVFLVGVTIVVCAKSPIKKRSLVLMGGGEPPEQKLKPNKRTFCNAFTGCGRKRSDGTVPTKDYEYDHDSSADNSDDTIDDMARDILAEARLWEALQARSSMRYPPFQRQGFFGRQKRSADNSVSDVNAEMEGKSHKSQ